MSPPRTLVGAPVIGKQRNQPGKKSRKPRTPVYIQGQSDAAYVLGVTIRTCQRWLDEGMPGRTDDDRYDIRACLEWRDAQRGTGKPADDESTVEAIRQHKWAQARLVQLRYEKEVGTMIPKTDSDARHATLLRWFVAVMERTPSVLASKVTGKRPADVRRIVEDYFNTIRREATTK